MKWEDYRKHETVAIKHCPTRAICPLGQLCGVDDAKDSRVLTPALAEVAKDDLVWVNWRNEHRVIVVKSGLIAIVSAADHDGEVFAVYGSGYCCGLAELYIDESVAYTYYLKALTDCTVCSVPANALRHRLEALPPAMANRIVASSLTNWSAAAFEMMKLRSLSRKSERLALLLRYLREQSGRLGSPLSAIRLSHDELATLLHSDRASVTRALHGLEKDGLVSLGYKTITLCDDFDRRAKDYGSLELAFHVPAMSDEG